MEYQDYLKEFKSIAPEWFKDQNWMDSRFKFYAKFFSEDHLITAEWSDIQALGNHIHSFQSMAIAKGNALGRENLAIEEYRKRFLYIIRGTDSIMDKIDSINSGEMALPKFGHSSISELFAYAFPNQFVVYNRRDLEAVKFLGIEIDKTRGDSFGAKFVKYNDAIKPLIKAYEEIVGLQTNTTIQLEIDQFFSWIYSEKIDSSQKDNENTRRYWIYAPGEKAHKWDEFRTEEVLGLGWDELGDLSRYDSKKDLTEELKKAPKSKGSRKNDSTANWEFSNIMSIGDIVFVKDGRNTILGRGVITSDYYFNNEHENFKSRRKVKWTHSDTHIIDWDLPLKTLTDVTKYKSDDPKFENYYDQFEAIFKDQLLVKQIQRKQPLNQILYGPPGTGKTRKTIELSCEILTGLSDNDYSTSLSIFKEHLHDRIEFITFHQNYSYEDFVQGLRPDTDADNQAIAFEKKDGIFMRMSINAAFEYYKYYENKRGSKEIDLIQAFNLWVDDVSEAPDKVYKTSSGKKLKYVDTTSQNNLKFSHEDKENSYVVSGDRLIKLYKIYNHIEDIKNVHTDIRDAIGGCNTTVYWVALKEFIKFVNTTNIKSDKKDLDKATYEDKKKYLESFQFPSIAELEKNNVPAYVLIIDEINRANISRVFGELITLLESDKRAGGEIPLSCVLPSDDTLVVPPNLYIIGTMNTADKSIALLDVALRRRFEFIPMYPGDVEDQSLILEPEIFKKLNEKIRKDKGPDFMIGHSYFMKKGDTRFDINLSLKNKIVPLLLEYYMNNEKAVKDVCEFAGLEVDTTNYPMKVTKTVR